MARTVTPEKATIRKSRKKLPPTSDEVLMDKAGPIAPVQEPIKPLNDCLTKVKKIDEQVDSIRKEARDQIAALEEKRTDQLAKVPAIFDEHKIEGAYVFTFKGHTYDAHIKPTVSISKLED